MSIFNDKWSLQFALTLKICNSLEFKESSMPLLAVEKQPHLTKGLAKHKQSFVHLWNICCRVIEKKRSQVFFFLVSSSSSPLKLEFWVEFKVRVWKTDQLNYDFRLFMKLIAKKMWCGNFTNFPFYSSYSSRCWWPELKYGRRMELFIASRSANVGGLPKISLSLYSLPNPIFLKKEQF